MTAGCSFVKAYDRVVDKQTLYVDCRGEIRAGKKEAMDYFEEGEKRLPLLLQLGYFDTGEVLGCDWWRIDRMDAGQSNEVGGRGAQVRWRDLLHPAVGSPPS